MQHASLTVDVRDVNANCAAAPFDIAPPANAPAAAEVTPSNYVVGGLVTAPNATRIFAVITDWILWSVIPAGGGTLAWVCAALVGLDASDTMTVVLVCGAALVLAVWLLQIYLVSTTGQTLGKRWLGIRIVCTDGRNPGFVRGYLLRTGVLRAIEFLLSPLIVVPPIFWVVNVCMLGTQHGRTIHDRIAGTRVVVG